MVQPRRFSERCPVIETVLIAQERGCNQAVQIVLNGHADKAYCRVRGAADSSIPSPQVCNAHRCLLSARSVEQFGAFAYGTLCRLATTIRCNPMVAFAQYFHASRKLRKPP